MKKVKIVFWLIILIIIAIIIYQNLGFLKDKPELSLNALFVQYNDSQFSNAVIVTVVFLAGLLVSYFSSLADRFKSRKTIKKLNTEIVSHIKELSEFRADAHTKNKPIGNHKTNT